MMPLALIAGGALHAMTVQGADAKKPAAGSMVQVKMDDQRWEYLIEPEPSLERANELGADRWDFAGLYGQSDLGTAVSLTLWKRPLLGK